MPDGPDFRQTRKYLRQTLGGKKRVADTYGEVIAEQCVKVLLRIMDNASQGGQALAGEIRQSVHSLH
jgi:hypothetical protein